MWIAIVILGFLDVCLLEDLWKVEPLYCLVGLCTQAICLCIYGCARERKYRRK